MIVVALAYSMTLVVHPRQFPKFQKSTACGTVFEFGSYQSTTFLMYENSMQSIHVEETLRRCS